MKKIIFITNSFPFGTGEKSFITPEFEVLKDKFEFVIVSRNTKDEQTTVCPSNVKLYRYNAKKNYNTVTLLLKAFSRMDLYKELVSCIITGNGNKKNILNIIKVMMRGIHFSEYLKDIRRALDDKSVLFYTYWNDFSAYSCTMIKHKSDKIVSRLHGADLYKVRSNNWQPYKNAMNDKVDALYFISKEGLDYYKNTYKDYDNKLRLAYLGVARSDLRTEIKEDSDTLKLVTVSRCVEVKRLELLIEALSIIKDTKIKWVHIGDGEQYDMLKKLAENKLGINVTYEFKGYMENKDIIPYVTTEGFDFLVNVSYSEGMPVTMMEMMSCGLPVIATNVGGVSEIVKHEENGYLLKSDIDKCELARFLMSLADMPYEKKKNFTISAYKTWEKLFFDKKNHMKFAEDLMNL